MPVVDVAVMAGGTPAPGEPLYAFSQGRPKALLPIGGRPMVQWVLDAVGAATSIRNISIVGLGSDHPPLSCRKPLRHVPDHGSLVRNLMAAATAVRHDSDAPTYLLTVGSDIPTITSAIIDWAATTPLASGHDAYGFIVPKEVMEPRFPGSRRRYFKLVEGRFALGNLALFKPATLSDAHQGWHRVVAARKSMRLKLALLVGPEVLIRMVLGRMSRAALAHCLHDRLDIDAQLLECDFPEAAMDVDIPHQYDMLRRELEH